MLLFRQLFMLTPAVMPLQEALWYTVLSLSLPWLRAALVWCSLRLPSASAKTIMSQFPCVRNVEIQLLVGSW